MMHSHRSAERISTNHLLVASSSGISHPTFFRYIIRDFQYSADQIEWEREELHTADTAEKELWVRSRSLRPNHGWFEAV
jgi:hypothetical protein